ncbi:hypothetical protein J2X45_003391 [Caulobacter sp. BE264]|uniref:gpW family head-tail joining protein n=1 Tax=Caulobacter sp. BE264 TaxID=2817724 RepID=UPI002866D3A0|nr:gpW family head-tail joining protein [Caulobacter sp. BE264]MDR7232285.1 hypothetical protein [Caulobacter sp. BE264]
MPLTLQEEARLARLEAAYEKALSGQRAKVTQSGGRRVEYGDVDLTKLKAEIEGLQAKATDGGRQRGALRFRL